MKHNRIIVSIISIMIVCSCRPKEEEKLLQLEKLSAGERLRRGNERFYTGQSLHPHASLARMRDLAKGQHPFAIVVSCSDSRAPDEIVFDQGLGDLFVIRTAGNVIADIGLGSLEYAIDHLGVKYVLVMGHEQCGAVKAFSEHAHPDNHINTILDTLMREPEINNLLKARDEKDYVPRLVLANVEHQRHKIIHSSEAMEDMVRNGDLHVEGAVYDIGTGKVKFVSASDNPQ